MRSKKLGINRRAARLAVPILQLFAHEGKADVLFDEPQQVGFRNLIFQAEVVEQRFRAVVLPHHDQQASDDRNRTEHGRMLSSNMLLLNLILLIDVTFSTPTGNFTHDRNGDKSNRADHAGPTVCTFLMKAAHLMKAAQSSQPSSPSELPY